MTYLPSDSLAGAAKMLSPLSALNSEPVSVALRAQQNVMRHALEWQIEALDFLMHRYEKDVRFMGEVARTTTPGDAFAKYAGFLQETFEDYSKEALKVTNRGAEEVSEAVEELRHETEELVEMAPGGNGFAN